MDEIFIPTPNAAFPVWFEENAILPFGVDEWVGIVDLLRHNGNRSARRFNRCSGVNHPLNAVTALIKGCIWATKFKAVFDLEAILTIEEAIETVDRIGAGSLGFTQNTAPSWYPDIAKFEEAKACLWQGSAPNDESAWDQEEVRNFLKAAMGNGEPNAYIDVDMWTWLKTKIHGGSIIVSDNGRIRKMEAGRKEARVDDIITTILGGWSSDQLGTAHTVSSEAP
ncbi:hypothetical protein V500_01177 [Pseudogymnoascus sp. VKM F-4518 (FW-2643)]|nr:hypothetical protein V500_01177 [Pseudogymnoascus sp. VKM F-4518 (FW-2643)]